VKTAAINDISRESTGGQVQLSCRVYRLRLTNARVNDDELSATNLSRRMITSQLKLTDILRPTSTRSSFCTLLLESPKLSRTTVLYYQAQQLWKDDQRCLWNTDKSKMLNSWRNRLYAIKLSLNRQCINRRMLRLRTYLFDLQWKNRL